MGWKAVDLDGTLASHDGWEEREHAGVRSYIYHVGTPVPRMVERVKQWIAEGVEVRIFTARAGPQPDGIDPAHCIRVVQDWCQEHLGVVLPVTATKDYACEEIWDDRAIQVLRDQGLTVLEGMVQSTLEARKAAEPA